MTKSRDLGNLVKTGAVQFPASLGTEGQTLKVNSGATGLEFADAGGAGSGTTTVANITELEALSAAQGDMAFVLSNDNVYIRKTAGWYKIATVTNNQLQSVTVTMSGGGSADGTDWLLALDGTDTTATGAATDPEGLSVTWSAAPISPASLSGNNIVVSGVNVATITQSTNVFTIDPVATTGTHNFSLRFSVTDGINATINADQSYILNFVTVVANSRYTTMLAQAVGANNGTNSTVTDSNSSNTPTVTGSPVSGTFSPYSPSGHSIAYDSTTNNVTETAAFPSGLNLGSDKFTLEFWVKRTLAREEYVFRCKRISGGYLQTRINANGALYSLFNGTSFVTSNLIPLSTWTHVAITKDTDTNNTIKVYFDGTQVLTQNGTNTSIGVAPFNFAGDGSSVAGDASFILHDFRLVKGSIIIPPSGGPTELLGEVSGTFLTSHTKPYLAYKRQTSSSDATLVEESFGTVTGGQAIVPDSPYDFSPYAAGDNGGSIYFDGVSDYILGNSGTALGTSNWTIQGWMYVTNANNDRMFMDFRPFSNGNYVTLKYDTLSSLHGKMHFSVNNSDVIVSNDFIRQNQWAHIALVKDSGTIKMYINGNVQTQTSSSFSTVNFLSHSSRPAIGVNGDNASTDKMRGYLSDVKVTIGTAEYTANFTPPTSPISSSNAELHFKGTDAAIINSSGKMDGASSLYQANLELAGDAKCVTTAVVHNSNTISPKSMYFDGTGDGVTLPNNLLTLSDAKSNFSVEMWAKFNSFNSGNLITSGTSNFAIKGYTTYGNNRLMVQMQGYSICVPADVTASNLATNTWYHIALVRQTGSPYATMKTFINGAEYATETSWKTSYIIPSEAKMLGGDNSGTSVQGYIQDFRFRPYYVGWVLNGSTYTYPVPAEELKG